MNDAQMSNDQRPRRSATPLVAAAILLALVVVAVVYVMQKRTSAGLMVYVGSSMRLPMEQCAATYQKRTGVVVTPSYADSGEVLAQVKNSGMGELAVLHEPYLTQGKRDGWAKETFVVAAMTPVIAVAEGNPKQVKGLKDFLRPELRVGLTDYRYATSGAIARDALKRAEILEQVMSRQPAPYENKSSGQTASQVLTGALDAVIVWDAVAGNNPDKLDIIPIEGEFMPPAFTDSEGVTYRDGHVPVGLLLLTTAKQPEEARKFVDFILSPQGQAIWKASGYSPPTASVESQK
jgi:molybdate transport system substrate-binding protein